MYGAGDVRIEHVPDARIVETTDALVRVTRACICGSDLWPYNQMEPNGSGRRMGHEFIGIVDAVGADVRGIRAGDLVVVPFAYSDGTCVFCHEGLHTSCLHGGFWGRDGLDGGQGEAVRVPLAGRDARRPPRRRGRRPDAVAPHALRRHGYRPPCGSRGAGRDREDGRGRGDGAVGLCGVIAAKRLGAERIILLRHHPDRLALAREFGATDIVSERGEEAVERVRELTGGFGAHSVLECVGHDVSTVTALAIARPGGAVGRIGLPQHELIPTTMKTFFDNVSVAGGPAPARAYIDELLPDVLEGRIEPGRVFDRVVPLDGVPDGYRAMNERASIKVMVKL
jgi:threonine dehydrogenase-like Zn-dependent dehydrogenase